MNAELANERQILLVKAGSMMYGTDTEDSDTNYLGIFMPNDELVYGFDIMQEVDLGIESKLDSGKNAPDAVDMKLYEFRKFIRLAKDNNPNILELLFSNDHNIVYINDFGKQLLECYDLFVSKKAYHRFIAYAVAQKKKMIIRTDKYETLEQAGQYFSEQLKNPENNKRLLIELKDSKLPFLKYKKSPAKGGQDVMVIGDISFQLHERWFRVLKKISERLNRASNRTGLINKYGYDTKFASHLIRLLLEGKELLLTGRIEFPLIDANLIRDIKLGKYAMKDVIEMADDLEVELESVLKISILPELPNYEEIKGLCIYLLKKYLTIYED